MAKNNIEDLRDHLFETLEALKDKDNPMPLDRALAVSTVAKTLIDSAKVEVDLLRVTKANPASNFFKKRELPPLLGGGGKPEP